jgi:hypothetical protein
LRSGTLAPDRVIDLHGMNLDRAWNAIDRGLDQAIARGERMVLLITGHHRPASRRSRGARFAPRSTTGSRPRGTPEILPQCAVRIVAMGAAGASISF